jgi:hypothetical protein
MVVAVQRSDWMLSWKVPLYISSLWHAVQIRAIHMTSVWYVTIFIAFVFCFVVCREEETRACSNDQSSEEEEAAKSPETSSTGNIAARANCCCGDTFYFVCCWCCLAGEGMWAFMFLEQCHQWYRSSGMCPFFVGWAVPGHLKDFTAFIVRVVEFSGTASPWRWRQCNSWKCWKLLTQWHNVASELTCAFACELHAQLICYCPETHVMTPGNRHKTLLYRELQAKES